MGSQHPDHIDFAGDYNLNGIIIQNHAGTGGKFPNAEGGLNIQSMVQELNIYEGINQNAVYGTLVLVDSTNLIGRLPIQGTERLFFKLSTPGTSKAEHIIDASEETGHPFYVYKISNKQQTSQGTLVYTIHFASREFMRNLRKRVSRAYEGKLSDIVQEIFGDKEGLDSRKKLYFEETRNQDKIVMPNISPFKAINMVAKRAMSGEMKGVGMYFYETTKGFYLQSWENMCTQYGVRERDPVMFYKYIPGNIAKPKGDDNVDEVKLELEAVESYKFINTFHDTAAAQALGTYGHRVITHNLYDKSYNTTDYNYHDQYNETMHADSIQDVGMKQTEPAIRDNPVDFDNLGVSDYPESMVTLMPTTQFLHNEETGSFGINVSDDARLEGVRNAQRMQVESGTAIRMTVKGQTQVQPGQVIDFAIRPVEEGGMTDGDKTYDPQYSGRYVITKVRHRVTKIDYKMVLECRKDSVREQIGGVNRVNFTGTTNNENAQYQQIGKFNRGGR